MLRKLSKEAWFARDSLDMSIGDVMKQLCSVVDGAKQQIADEAARYIVRIRRSVVLRLLSVTVA